MSNCWTRNHTHIPGKWEIHLAFVKCEKCEFWKGKMKTKQTKNQDHRCLLRQMSFRKEQIKIMEGLKINFLENILVHIYFGESFHVSRNSHTPMWFPLAWWSHCYSNIFSHRSGKQNQKRNKSKFENMADFCLPFSWICFLGYFFPNMSVYRNPLGGFKILMPGY